MKRKPIAAIGLATGAVALESAMPTLQKVMLVLNTALNTAANSLSIQLNNLLASPTSATLLPTLQRVAENGYYHLTATNLWNYAIILTAVILEGPIATMLGGVWASMGRVNFWAILMVSIVAGMMADSFWYFLGYFGREQVIQRWGRFLKIDLDTINKIEAVLFGADSRRVIFTSKLTSALIIPTLVAAGITEMGWRRVMRTMLPAQFLWSLGMTSVGFIAADSFARISHDFRHWGWALGATVAILYIGRIVYRWRKTAVNEQMGE